MMKTMAKMINITIMKMSINCGIPIPMLIVMMKRMKMKKTINNLINSIQRKLMQIVHGFIKVVLCQEWIVS